MVTITRRPATRPEKEGRRVQALQLHPSRAARRLARLRRGRPRHRRRLGDRLRLGQRRQRHHRRSRPRWPRPRPRPPRRRSPARRPPSRRWRSTGQGRWGSIAANTVMFKVDLSGAAYAGKTYNIALLLANTSDADRLGLAAAQARARRRRRRRHLHRGRLRRHPERQGPQLRRPGRGRVLERPSRATRSTASASTPAPATTPPARSCAPRRTRRRRLPDVHHDRRPRLVSRRGGRALPTRPSPRRPPPLLARFAAVRLAGVARSTRRRGGRRAQPPRSPLRSRLARRSLVARGPRARLPADVAAAGDRDVGEHGADDQHRRHGRAQAPRPRPAQIGDIVDGPRARRGPHPLRLPAGRHPPRWSRSRRTGRVTTKGDARKEPDPFTVPRTAVTTSVVAHIPAGRPGARVPRQHARPALARRRRRAAARAAAAGPLPRGPAPRRGRARGTRTRARDAPRAGGAPAGPDRARGRDRGRRGREPPAPRSTARLVASSSVAGPAPVVTAPRPAPPAVLAPALVAASAPTPAAPHVTAPRLADRTRTRRRTGPRRARRRWTAPRRGPRAGARRPRRAGPHRTRGRRPRRAGPGRARLRHAGPRRARARRGRGRHPGGRGARAGRVGHPVADLARRMPAPAAPPTPPVPPARFPARAPVRVAGPVWAAPPAVPVAPGRGVLCAVGGP